MAYLNIHFLSFCRVQWLTCSIRKHQINFLTFSYNYIASALLDGIVCQKCSDTVSVSKQLTDAKFVISAYPKLHLIMSDVNSLTGSHKSEKKKQRTEKAVHFYYGLLLECDIGKGIQNSFFVYENENNYLKFPNLPILVPGSHLYVSHYCNHCETLKGNKKESKIHQLNMND